MFGLTAFDKMIARNGDGLRPEMRALFERLATIETSTNVTDLADYRTRTAAQSGPNPVAPGNGVEDNVIPLRSARIPTTAQRKIR